MINNIKMLLEVVFGFIVLVGLVAVGFVPNFIFQLHGWTENPSLDLLSRIMGCIIVVLLVATYINFKTKRR